VGPGNRCRKAAENLEASFKSEGPEEEQQEREGKNGKKRKKLSKSPCRKEK